MVVPWISKVMSSSVKPWRLAAEVMASSRPIDGSSGVVGTL
jgi:hypothetical protein